MPRMLAISAALAAALSAGAAAAPSLNAPVTGEVVGVHDPAIIESPSGWRVFSTTRRGDGGVIPIRASRDLAAWRRQGSVFAELPAWAVAAVPGARGAWAPDVSKVGGAYRLYYSVSTFGSNRSTIGLATSPTLDPASPAYRWTDRGQVLASGPGDDFNAIDPNLVVDAEGGQWLAFGSFWSGIKLVRLDPETGKPPPGRLRLHSLASRPSPGAVEAPFVVRHGGFYYLFASYDFCCRGAASSYYTVVGRAKAVTGPYVDRRGRAMTQGGGEVLLRAGPGERFKGPGHVAIARAGGRDLIAWHAYDARNDGLPTLRLAPLTWSRDGWPSVRP